MKKWVKEVFAEAENIQPTDIIIKNAGIAAESHFLDIEETKWNRILSVNIRGMFYVAQAVCRHMDVRRHMTVRKKRRFGKNGQ